MKKTIITISVFVLIAGSIGVVLANNKAKIDKAAHPVTETAIVPVKVHTVQEDSFHIAFSITGTTSPVREVKVASEVQGKLVSLYIKNGDFVSAGQLLATLDASVFTAQLRSIETSLAKAGLDIARYTKLIELGGASSMQLESAVLQQRSLQAQKKDVLQQMEHMNIRAPFSGKIENVKVEKGSYVTHGTVLSDLLDVSILKINTYLSEKEAFRIKTGQVATIRSAVLAQPVTGQVTTISDKADASGKFLAEVQISNKGKDYLKAGMLAEVSFAVGSLEKGLSIPVSALVGSAKQGKVFVAKGNQVELRSIRAGITTAEKVQVVEGLQAGEQVVTSGQLNLEQGSPISINR
jgi:membrane fusion protein (multidrug efflux system)